MKKLLSLMVVAVMIGCAGAVSAEETVIAPNPDPIVLDTDIQILPVVKGTVTLTEGWNLIAIPVLPAEQLRIKDFIGKVESDGLISVVITSSRGNDFVSQLNDTQKEEIGALQNAYALKIYEGDSRSNDLIVASPDNENVASVITFNNANWPDELIASIKNAYKINDIIRMKPKWNVSAVAVYKDGRFRMYTRENATYNMVPGEAYFVHCKYLGPRPVYQVLAGPDYPMPVYHPKTTITIAGKCVNATVSLDLNKGWNGAALARLQNMRVIYPVAPDPVTPIEELPVIPDLTLGTAEPGEPILANIIARGFNLAQLSRELSEQGVKATRIIFWNSDVQGWDQYALPYKTDPICAVMPRVINDSEGFFLLCEENGLYIPGLQIQKPPITPIPVPLRVSYTGTIMRSYTIPENFVPYKFVLECSRKAEDGTTTTIFVPLKGADETIEAKLGVLADEPPGTSHYVEGVMQTMKWTSMLPPYGGDTDVMVVELIDAYRL
ncbi:MAG: hypothetical protein PHX20_02160 [Candidatus Omnitrophica bacterium]|nr:hypothetical protein [Candidatus Omnitrophota bacterium]MDD5436326.1 hypothetical protein [Candidatus Omnitrophota bacterium]